MANITFAVFGSLGDLHPHVALALELKRRGHRIVFAADFYYQERLEALGFAFFPMRPHIDPADKDLARDFMDADKGFARIERSLFRRADLERENRFAVGFDRARARRIFLELRPVCAAEYAMVRQAAFFGRRFSRSAAHAGFGQNDLVLGRTGQRTAALARFARRR